MGLAKTHAKEQSSNETKVVVLDCNWKMNPLPDNLTSASVALLVRHCQILKHLHQEESVTHMKKEQNLVPDFSGVRERPKLDLRKRAPLSEEEGQAQAR
jgi:hypothetical protein